MERFRAVVSLQGVIKMGGRGRAITSRLLVPENCRNVGAGRGCRKLPWAAIKWQDWWEKGSRRDLPGSARVLRA